MNRVLSCTKLDESMDVEEPIVMRHPTSRPARGRIAAFGFTTFLLLGLLLPAQFSRAQELDIVGDYSITLVRLQIPTDVANGSNLIGRWRISFLADGTYQSERLDLGVLVTGTYQASGDTLTIIDESGLLSCSNPTASTGEVTDVASAEYTYEMDSGNLKLTAISDGCALRRVLFTTSDFSTYVACTTAPIDLASNSVELGATPELDDALSDLIRAEATPVSEGRNPGNSSSSVDGQIDSLLAQLTACWSTGDPTRFLPLLSDGFRGSFIGANDQETSDMLSSLQAAMQVPIVWERAGDVKKTGNNSAEAVVRTTAADQEEFVRYLFVLEDGSWKWDGSASE